MKKIGKIVAVIHRSVENPKTGLVNVVPAKQKNQRINTVYSNGTVQTSSGDVWNVIPNPNTDKFKGAAFISTR